MGFLKCLQIRRARRALIAGGAAACLSPRGAYRGAPLAARLGVTPVRTPGTHFCYLDHPQQLGACLLVVEERGAAGRTRATPASVVMGEREARRVGARASGGMVHSPRHHRPMPTRR